MSNIVRSVFVALIVLGSVGYLYLGAQIMKIRGDWTKAVAKLEADLGTQLKANDLLADGDLAAQRAILRPDEAAPLSEQLKAGQSGIRQLKVALQDALVDRGRVWDQCQREQIADNGDVRVKVSAPTPHGMKPDMLLQAFDAADIGDPTTGAGGAYLGEFKVAGVDDAGNISLSPAQRLTPRKLQQLQGSQRNWLLYELMPSDRISAFAGLTADELKKLIPESTLADYANDGEEAEDSTPATELSYVWVPNQENTGEYTLIGPKPDEFGNMPVIDQKNQPHFEPANKTGNYDLVEGRIVAGKYQPGKFHARKLRDYDAIFLSQYQSIWHVDDVNRRLTAQVANFTKAVEGIKGDNGARTLVDKQYATLEAEKKLIEAERDLVKDLAGKMTDEIETLQKKNAAVLAETKQLAARFTTAQLDAARRIDALTESAAR